MLRWLRKKKTDQVKTEDFQVIDPELVIAEQIEVNPSPVIVVGMPAIREILVPETISTSLTVPSTTKSIAPPIPTRPSPSVIPNRLETLGQEQRYIVERISDDTSYKVQMAAEDISQRTEAESLRIRTLLECCLPWTRQHERLE